MKRLLSPLVFPLLLCLTLVVHGKSNPLPSHKLDQISAGSAVAPGEPSASNITSASVEVGGSSSFSGVSGANIANAADGMDGNGANVWSANKLAHPNNVKQLNLIAQEGAPCSWSPAKVDSIDGDESLDGVSTNAIATDNSSTTNKSTYLVSLSGSTGVEWAKALDVVNAAGVIVEGMSSCL